MTTPCLPGMFSDPEPAPMESHPALNEPAIARTSGRHRAGEIGGTLRDRYRELLIAEGPLTDHAAAARMGVLSTTVGARRLELMEELPGCIEAVGRERMVFAQGRAVSRTTWRWAR
jgi:hypothetical protein